jgi:hypothetical protein
MMVAVCLLIGRTGELSSVRVALGAIRLHNPEEFAH